MARQSIFEGDRFLTNSGDVATVIGYESVKKITVRFKDGSENVVYGCALRSGSVLSPLLKKENTKVGDRFKLNNGGVAVVVEYHHSN